MRMRSASTQPEDDSPGDSDADAGYEFNIGLEYLPDTENDLEVDALIEEYLSPARIAIKPKFRKSV